MAESSIALAGSEVSPNVVHDEESKTSTVSHVGTPHMHFGNVDSVHVGDIHHHHHVSESVQDQEECYGSTSYQEMEVDTYIEPIHGPVKTEGDGGGAFEADPKMLQYIQKLVANFNDPRKWQINQKRCIELGTMFIHQGRTLQAKVQFDSVRSFDCVINDIGNALGVEENSLIVLGIHLGFQYSEVEMFLATNRANGNVSPKGTKNMLFAWRDMTTSAKQVEYLREALVQAKLKLVAEEHLRDLQ